ncbi:MAG: hypothetical protein JKY43_08940 [Phycisphaerales bacterium]|nr:hypothetical protein [Phycisphaerales bacterium]
MSEQNNSNTSFAHAFLPGLILGLIVGALAGALVPDMMTAKKFKVDPNHTYTPSPRDERPAIDLEAQAIVDAAEKAAADAAEAAEEGTDDAQDAAQDLIDDAESTLPSTP